MKRLISILLAFCILLTNTGWALTAHYCMGERVGINLSHVSLPDDDEHECDKCGMKKASNNGCCHDEEVIIKGAQDAVSGMAYIQADLAVTDLPTSAFTFSRSISPIYLSKDKPPFHPHGPPGLRKVPLYLRNCVFLI